MALESNVPRGNSKQGKVHSRLLHFWKVDDYSFCNLVKLRVAYVAYYDFMKQDCKRYRIVPMDYELENN